MKVLFVTGILAALLATLLVFIVIHAESDLGGLGDARTAAAMVAFGSNRPPGDLSTIILPDDGMDGFIQTIESASNSVDLVIYELQDPAVEAALASAAARGVAVRVLLDQGYYGVPSASNINEPAYEYLKSHGVTVGWTPSYFALTHQKTLVVDDRTAIIMTFNLVAQYYPTSRDFGIVDTDPTDVAAIEATFNADARRDPRTPPSGDGLVWSPGSEDDMVRLIESATQTLEIYNEEMSDQAVIDALVATAARGVNVNVLMTYSSEWDRAFEKLKDGGVNVRTFPARAALYLHAKIILADGIIAFVGSENFSAASLYDNRELGITFADPAAIAPLQKTFESDWERAN